MKTQIREYDLIKLEQRGRWIRDNDDYDDYDALISYVDEVDKLIEEFRKLVLTSPQE